MPLFIPFFQGKKPTASPAGPITFLEEASSALITLGGTDEDPADSSALIVVITALPTKSTLVQNGANGQADVEITSVPFALTNPVVFFRGEPFEFGADSFAFRVVDLVNMSSLDETVKASITHVNHPPTAGVQINSGLMNQPLAFNVFGQDPDNDIPLSIYITSAPAEGSLYQGDGDTLIPSSASPSTPVLVTDFNGKLIYVPPTNRYGDPFASITILVDDNSGYPDSKSPSLTVDFNITRVDLPPSVENVTVSMPMNSRATIPIRMSDPQGYPTYINIVTFPSHGVLYRSDNVTQINPNNPTTDFDGVVIYEPPMKQFDDGNIPFATFTYVATSPTSSLSSQSGHASVSVNRTFAPPKFTGATVYSIADNTNLSMLLSGSSELGSYSIVITNTLTPEQGLLYVR